MEAPELKFSLRGRSVQMLDQSSEEVEQSSHDDPLLTRRPRGLRLICRSTVSEPHVPQILNSICEGEGVKEPKSTKSGKFFSSNRVLPER